MIFYFISRNMGKGGFEPPASQFRTEINAEANWFQYHSKLDHLPNII